MIQLTATIPKILLMRINYFLFALLISGIANAQELFTLEDAVGIALQNNYAIRIAKNTQEISANNVSLGNAGFLPNVNAGLTQSNGINNTDQNFLDGRVVSQDGAKSHTLNADASLDWTIFDGLLMFTSYDQLKKLREVGVLNTRANIEATIAQVSLAYYDVVQLSQSIKAIQEALLVSRERVNFINDKYLLGSASRADLLQAQVDMNEDSSLLLTQQQELAVAKIALNELLARDVMTEFSVIDTIIIDTALNFGQIREVSLSSNSQLLINKTYQQIAALELKSLRSQRFPQIGVNLSYNYLKNTNEAGFVQSNQSYGLTYGVSARINIFDGLNLNRQIQNARISIDNNRLLTEQFQLSLESSIASSYKTYQNILAQVALETSNVDIASQTLEFAREKYRVGSMTNLELREIQLNYLNAQNRLISARYRAKLSEIGLLQLSGTIVKN
ncbi:MAG: TolC family protein [Chitinophagales bacterium]|nr:TolC family protein [Chitinophagales bacterium]